MNKLKIIGFEGIDGSGKTSLIKRLLSDELFNDNSLYTTRRNPPSPFVEKMYSIIHTFKESFNALDLFVKDMAYRYSKMPLNKIIFSDRTFISAIIFYKSIKEISNITDTELYNKINEYSKIYDQDLTIVLLTKVEKARERIYKNRESLMPVEDIEFQKVCANKFEMIKPSKSKLIINTYDLNETEIYNIVKKRLINQV